MCPVMIITIYFEADHKKLVSSQKSSIFGPQKGHFGQLGPQNGPPSGQTGTYRKTEGIQSYLRIWRSCHPIESGPSEPKKRWFHRRSIKKRRISGKKKGALFNSDHVLATTGQSCQKKKVPFSQMNISLLANFGLFFGKKRIFGPFSAFRQNVKTAVSP